ncbi:MAG: carbohydrate kinase [Fibrobacter sp.]|nr:carbohydrate kinase [Fibrobacter sp.]
MGLDGYLLGYDIGSSSIKATVLEISTGQVVSSATSPENTELEIISQKAGWAEQHPDTWWMNIQNATAKLRCTSNIDFHDIRAVGISYQMHGLVMVDKKLKPLAPSIIWCDSRAVGVGRKALKDIGEQRCLSHLFNPPGNFTASKLKWVAEYQKEIFRGVHHFMLPGDYIALRMTGSPATTVSGLSEGILWDFKAGRRADFLLDYYGINPELIPPVVPTFGVQGAITEEAASLLGLRAGTPVSYRAGDQPNNALSLNVLEPGEIAATAGTSGVVYGVTDQALYDTRGRVNTFLHVSNEENNPRLGILLCVNGTGILNRWMKNLLGSHNAPVSYEQMNREAENAPVGCDGLCILPFGNGAERTLGNLNVNASVHGIDLSRHTRAHLLRAAQEGIVFALMNGIDILRSLGLRNKIIRAGDANMFKSRLFAEAFASVAGNVVELYNTDGSQGAARGAGVGAGIYKGLSEAFANLSVIRSVEPNAALIPQYTEAYEKWLSICNKRIEQANEGIEQEDQKNEMVLN